MGPKPNGGQRQASTGGMLARGAATLAWDAVGSGAPVVLLHAGIADRRMWDANLPALAARHRVLRYDLRGFGASRLSDADFAPSDDLRALLDAWGHARVALVGASYGGRIALEFALEQPERVAALVTVGAPIGGVALSQSIDDAETEIDAAMTVGDVERAAEVDTRIWVDGPFRAATDVEPGFRARALALARDIYVVGHAGGRPLPLDPPASTRLEQISAPTLVIVGALDQPDILSAATQLAARIPRARLATLPDTAHLPSLERPAAFDALVLDFLAGVAGVAGTAES